ncbi:MAG: hypothetical protein ACRYGK_19140 [Janthinobacterium lividum]
MMADDREQLYAALRNADAAGDTKAAQRLASYIQSLPTNEAPASESAPQESHGVLDTLAAIPGNIKEAITGSKRATPESEAAPDWAGMPELNSFSMASAKTGLGTLLSNPGETAKIIKSNFPGVETRKDDKGNIFLRSSIDGKEYAIKPGFQASDIPRAVAGAAAFTPAGRATTVLGSAAAAAGTQALIEGSQAATGGDFNGGEVGMAALAGGAVPAVSNVIRAAAGPAKQLVQRLKGTPDPVAGATSDLPAAAASSAPETMAPAMAAAPEATSPTVNVVYDRATGATTTSLGADTAAPAANGAAEAGAMAPDQLTKATKMAAGGGIGSKAAKDALVAEAAPDVETLAAAQRLGIAEHLQPDHVSTNQSYRELSQAIKSIPGSAAHDVEVKGLDAIGKRADDLIEEIGGTTDMSQLSSDVKGRMQGAADALEEKEKMLYDKIRADVPQDARVAAPNVLSFIEQRAKDLDGVKNLSPLEKRIFSRLSPKNVRSNEEVPGNPLIPGQINSSTKTVTELRHPTYALLDDVRKDVGAAARMAGPFKDADTGLAKKLYSLLSDDQGKYLDSVGMSGIHDAAKATTAVRKGLEDDLSGIFGSHLDGSLVAGLNGGVKSLAQGDNSKFLRLLNAIPDDLRPQVVASGLNSAFGKSARNGQLNFSSYANWFEGLQRNKQAYNAFMMNLPAEARSQLHDLYRVSNGVRMATKERINNGRIQAISDQFKAPEHLVGRIYENVKHEAVSTSAGMAATVVGGPVFGMAVKSALTKGPKTNALKAADALIASPEFVHLAKQVGQPSERAAVKKMAGSMAFRRFAKEINLSRDPSAHERWIQQSLQAQNQQANQ